MKEEKYLATKKAAERLVADKAAERDHKLIILELRLRSASNCVRNVDDRKCVVDYGSNFEAPRKMLEKVIVNKSISTDGTLLTNEEE